MSDLPPLPDVFAPVAHYRHLGLAVSGGADSLALMVLAAEWAKPLGIQLTVYTVDHGLRAEAADEVRFVVEVAAKLGLPARQLCWVGEKPQAGVQAAARAARYELIKEAMRADGAEVLLTAHHQHDQAETVLMRLAHGSGIGGTGGMAPESDIFGVRVCRPLLDIAPEMLLAVVRRCGLEPVNDPSNDDTHYERVRWRKALPMLEELGLDADQLAGFAKRARRAEAELSQVAGAYFRDMATRNDFGTVSLDTEKWLALSDEMRLRLVRRALDLASGGSKPHALQQVEEMVAKLAAADSHQQTFSGVRIDSDGRYIRFAREAGRLHKDTHEILPQQSVIWDGRFCVENLSECEVYVASAGASTRSYVEKLLPGERFSMREVHSAPLVRNTDGAVLAIGKFALDEAVKVTFARD